MLDSLLYPGIAKVHRESEIYCPKFCLFYRDGCWYDWRELWVSAYTHFVWAYFSYTQTIRRGSAGSRESGSGKSRDYWISTTLKCGPISSPSGAVKASSARARSSMELSGSLPRVESGAGTALQQALNQPSHREGACPCLFTGSYLELGFEREMLSRSLAVSCSSPSPSPSSFPCAVQKQYWSWILDKLEILHKLHFVGKKGWLKKRVYLEVK